MDRTGVECFDCPETKNSIDLKKINGNIVEKKKKMAKFEFTKDMVKLLLSLY